MSECKDMYDAFLSYSFSDVDLVELIAQRLSDLGAIIWFDRWSLVPGQEVKSCLEKALNNSYAILIFIGSSSKSPWQGLELKSGINRKKKII